MKDLKLINFYEFMEELNKDTEIELRNTLIQNLIDHFQVCKLTDDRIMFHVESGDLEFTYDKIIISDEYGEIFYMFPAKELEFI